MVLEIVWHEKALKAKSSAANPTIQNWRHWDESVLQCLITLKRWKHTRAGRQQSVVFLLQSNKLTRCRTYLKNFKQDIKARTIYVFAFPPFKRIFKNMSNDLVKQNVHVNISQSGRLYSSFQMHLIWNAIYESRDVDKLLSAEVFNSCRS